MSTNYMNNFSDITKQEIATSKWFASLYIQQLKKYRMFRKSLYKWGVMLKKNVV